MTEGALTLSQFQQRLGNAIRMTRDVQNVWVQAEFSDLRVAGGHCYMELLEKDPAGQTRAKIRAMIWAGTLGMLRAKFREATGRDFASGMKVLVRGSANHHSVYGLSFTISDIDPSYTLGDMERIRREILDKLAREGVLNANKVLPLPVTPQRIAVISAEGAAGYGDFMNQLAANPYGFAVYTLLFGAVMQGERTPASVMAALDKVEMTVDQWDAVVIIRGGGATTDLNGFDNYELARRVATFPLPVIVGIGHERDRTVLDEIAAVRCKTPTAAAAWILDTLHNAYGVTTELVRRIAVHCSDALRGEHLRINSLTQQLPAYVKARVVSARLSLQQLAAKTGSAASQRTASARNKLTRDSLWVENSAKNALRHQDQLLIRAEDKIRILSPENTLRRGYSITRVNGKAITSPEQATEGSTVEITLACGTLYTTACKPE